MYASDGEGEGCCKSVLEPIKADRRMGREAGWCRQERKAEVG
jgi:hypothetical protein